MIEKRTAAMDSEKAMGVLNRTTLIAQQREFNGYHNKIH